MAQLLSYPVTRITYHGQRSIILKKGCCESWSYFSVCTEVLNFVILLTFSTMLKIFNYHIFNFFVFLDQHLPLYFFSTAVNESQADVIFITTALFLTSRAKILMLKCQLIFRIFLPCTYSIAVYGVV